MSGEMDETDAMCTGATGTPSGPDSAPSIPRWLNTLGLLASQGIDVVVRHSFLDHGHNHLVDQNFNPLPVGLPGGITLVLASPCLFWGGFFPCGLSELCLKMSFSQICFLQC